MRIISLVILTALLLWGCVQGADSSSGRDGGEPGREAFTRYASGFRVFEQGSHTVVEVTDPWQQSQDIIFTYVLGPDAEVLPQSLKKYPYIRTPVERVIALSTTHVAMIEQLGSSETIVGLSGTDFIYNPSVKERVETGDVKDVGYGQGLDFESIVGLNPDVLFLYGVEGQVVSTLEKLTDLGIPAVFCGEYLEQHPLGKAEWIRFFSLFFDKEEQSSHFFRHVDSAYNALSSLTSQVSERPNILTGLPWKDTWYMAGGESFAARLIKDAGGTYLWQDNPSTQAVPMDLETVYLKGVHADIWINPGAATSLSDILLMDERFGDLPVLNKGSVFNNNARINARGGNDYWESGTVRPDLILADLIGIFHPDLMTDHRFVYYRQLK